MNSNLKKLPIIALAGFTILGLSIGSRPKTESNRVNPVSSFNRGKPTPEEAGHVMSIQSNGPLSLEDSIKQMANRLGKRIYGYQIEIERIPENQIYQINKSGHNQYEITRKGEGYSKTTVIFYTDKKLSIKEAIKFAEQNPDKCIPILPTIKSKELDLDEYQMNYDEYTSDPGNEIDFAPEVYDFLAD